MSTDYTHFSNLSFTNLFGRGPDGSESIIINSSGVFVGSLAISGALSVASLTTTGKVTAGTLLKATGAGSTSSASLQIVNGNRGFYAPTTAAIGILVAGGELARFARVSGRTELKFDNSSATATTDLYIGVTNQAMRIAGGTAVSSGGGIYMYGPANAKPNYIEFYNNGTLAGTINSAANLVMVGTVKGANGTASAPGLGLGTSSGLGVYRSASKTLGFAAGGVAAATLTSAALAVTGTLAGSNFSGTHSGTSSGTNTGDVTLANTTNGLTLASQILTMAVASSAATGTVTTGTQSFAGTKTFVTALAGTNVASASTAASGVVTTGAQSLAGAKTFAGKIVTFAGSVSTAALTVASAGLGIYRAGVKQLGFTAGAANVGTWTTASLTVVGVLKTNFATTASNATIAAMISTANTVKITGATATSVHGIIGGTAGQMLHVVTNGATVTFKNQSGTASGGNRIYTAGGVDNIIGAAGTPGGATLVFDSDSGNWTIVGYH